MRSPSRLAFLVLAALAALAVPGCGDKGVGATAKVKPHADIDRTGQYCRYTITAAPAGAALKKDDIICIVCPESSKCEAYSKIEEEDEKTTYDVSNKDAGLNCQTCPKGTDTPAGYTRELRK